ncbi:MAG: ribosome biogenesis GTPase Der [Deltaproteobacteria bacterium]|nr:ribosome biogenesis GTPase Der [Candidatus Anaeroferrophillus wilburensis]MBN2888268.1 ribosome biogenesis GTPase Der [Deltaproteobacteria bacterium]
MKPCIAIIGRPNVGKSTLFNRLVKKKKAIAADTPGVTRDRIFADASWDGREFLLVDTGGMVLDYDTGMQTDITRQSMLAVDEADAIIFLLDGKDGVTADDERLALYLRKSRKKVFWVVNKVESHRDQAASVDFYRLGMETLYEVSAAHGLGINDLLEAVTAVLPESEPEVAEAEGQPLRIAVIGKPNVGKSSLLNQLIGEKRLVTNDQPGTTMDSIEVPLDFHGRHYLFFDTAGLRRKARVHDQVESFATVATMRSVDYAQIVLLMIDATAGITDQDLKIASLAHEKGKVIIFLFNKIDLISGAEFNQKKMFDLLTDRFSFIYRPHAIRISVLKKQGINKIFPLIEALDHQLHKRITTGILNRTLKRITEEHQHPLIYRHPLKFYYITQLASIPPAFVVFCNTIKGIEPSYIRYLKKKLVDYLEFEGIPLRIYFRKR